MSNTIRIEAGSIVVGEENSPPFMTLHPDGRISFAKRVRPDTAAQLFIDAIARQYMQRVTELSNLVTQSQSAGPLIPAPLAETGAATPPFIPVPSIETGEGVIPDPQPEQAPPVTEPELYPHAEPLPERFVGLGFEPEEVVLESPADEPLL